MFLSCHVFSTVGKCRHPADCETGKAKPLTYIKHKNDQKAWRRGCTDGMEVFSSFPHSQRFLHMIHKYRRLDSRISFFVLFFYFLLVLARSLANNDTFPPLHPTRHSKSGSKRKRKSRAAAAAAAAALWGPRLSERASHGRACARVGGWNVPLTLFSQLPPPPTPNHQRLLCAVADKKVGETVGMRKKKNLNKEVVSWTSESGWVERDSAVDGIQMPAARLSQTPMYYLLVKTEHQEGNVLARRLYSSGHSRYCS